MSYHDHLLYQITHRIRQSLRLEEILRVAVEEIQAFLQVDRVKIYQFEPDGSGQVIAEAVNLERLPSLLHLFFPAGDIPPESRDRFVQCRQRVIVDIETQQKITDQGSFPPQETSLELRYGPVDPCHVEYLKAMGVTASLVMPILFQGVLWGLLAIHHSQSRRFSRSELLTLRLLSDQLEIAIAQAHLLAQAQFQAHQEAAINRVSQLLHCPLDLSTMRRQVLETLVNLLEGSGGQLYLTATESLGQEHLFTLGQQPQANLSTLPAWHVLIAQGKSLSLQVPTLEHAAPSTPPGQPLWQELLTPLIVDIAALKAPWELVRAFQDTPIRTLVVVPLQFQQDYLGYVVIFRNGYDRVINWAGHREPDPRQQRPRLSFEAWQECQLAQTPRWSREDLRLMQSLAIHLHMATLQQQLTAKLRYQAYYDSLTQLANRTLFTEQLNLGLVQASDSAYLMAVGFLDLDRFKTINDTLGHDAGDQLLQVVAQRLRDSLEPWDMVARWGGDEFTLVLNRLGHLGEVSDRAHRILTSLAAPIVIANQELVVTASLGLALFPYDGDTAAVLIKHADTALNQAKLEGKNTFQLYCKGRPSWDLDTLVLESDLHRALDGEGLSLWFQPQVSLLTGELVGVEALARWHHPKLGMIPPDRFIPLAEETGLIRQLGIWALRSACQQHYQWRQEGLPPTRIAVNLSALQLRDPDLLFTVQQTLRRYGVPPEYLELEITETTAMADVELTLSTLKQLQGWGVHIALDDFGMGYSSLNTIKYFPIQTLKIDKAFVQDAVHNSSDAAIAKTIVALGKGLGLSVLAEGVENRLQLRFLQAIGCDYGQGYLFGKPMSCQDWKLWLRRHTQVLGERIFLQGSKVA